MSVILVTLCIRVTYYILEIKCATRSTDEAGGLKSFVLIMQMSWNEGEEEGETHCSEERFGMFLTIEIELLEKMGGRCGILVFLAFSFLFNSGQVAYSYLPLYQRQECYLLPQIIKRGFYPGATDAQKILWYAKVSITGAFSHLPNGSPIGFFSASSIPYHSPHQDQKERFIKANPGDRHFCRRHSAN